MSRELKPHGYYKEKGVVEKVFNKYVAEIAVLKTGDILQVIPLATPELPHGKGHCIWSTRYNKCSNAAPHADS